MKLNKVEAQHFKIILRTLRRAGIIVNLEKVETSTKFSYSLDPRIPNTLVNLIEQVESLAECFGSEQDPDIDYDDNQVVLTVYYHIGTYRFEIPINGDIVFSFEPKVFDLMLTITGIEIVKFTGSLSPADSVTLVTNLPCPTYPYEGFARLKIEIPPAQIDEYVAKNFQGVPISLVQV